MLNVEDEPKMTLEKVLETGKLRKMAVPVIEGKKKLRRESGLRINVFIVGWWTFPVINHSFNNKHLSEYRVIEGPV